MDEKTLAGTLEVRVTASRAELPVEGATVAVTTAGTGRQTLLDLLVTDESGLAGPVSLEAGTDGGEGLEPGGPAPFADYALWVEHPEYSVVHVERFQIFPGTRSVQQIDLIPLPQPVWTEEAERGEIRAEAQDL